MIKTACVTSRARCASRNCRSAAEYTNPAWRSTNWAKADSDCTRAYSRNKAMSCIGNIHP